MTVGLSCPTPVVFCVVLLAHCHLSSTCSSALKETLHLEVVDSEALTMKTVLGCVLSLVCVDDARAVDHRKYIDVYPRPYNHLVCDKHIPNWVREELGSDTDRPRERIEPMPKRQTKPAKHSFSAACQSRSKRATGSKAPTPTSASPSTRGSSSRRTGRSAPSPRAIPFCKTIQIMLRYHVRHHALNPQTPRKGPGGSSGGEGAAQSYGASFLGIGSGIGGSCRSFLCCPTVNHNPTTVHG